MKVACAGWVLLLLSSAAASSDERCSELGQTTRVGETSFENLDDLNREKGQIVVRTTGVLSYFDQSGFLCSPDRRLNPASPGSAGDCFALSFEWLRERFGALRVDRVLRQWNGSRVTVGGALEAPPKLWEHWLRVRKGAIKDVSFLAIVDDPARAEYCLDSTLPSVPSRFERDAVLTGNEHGLCVDGTGTSLTLDDEFHDFCVALGKPAVWQSSENEVEWKERPFQPPSPFATRDVVDFEVLAESLYLFTLFDQRLYVWDGQESRQLQGASVDELVGGADGWVYYRSRRLSRMGTVVWNAIERVNPRLDIERLWESDSTKTLGPYVLGDDIRAGLLTPRGVEVVDLRALKAAKAEGERE